MRQWPYDICANTFVVHQPSRGYLANQNFVRCDRFVRSFFFVRSYVTIALNDTTQQALDVGTTSELSLKQHNDLISNKFQY